MENDINMILWNELKKHRGHKVSIVSYGDWDNPTDICLECEDCNEVVLDAKGKQNGRGAYLCFSAECLQKARRSKGLERSLKISIPDEIYDRLEEELKELDTKQ